MEGGCRRGPDACPSCVAGASCAAERRAGTHAAHGWAASAAEGGNKAATWSTMGGVSEAITDSFFTSVLGCSECAGVVTR